MEFAVYGGSCRLIFMEQVAFALKGDFSFNYTRNITTQYNNPVSIQQSFTFAVVCVYSITKSSFTPIYVSHCWNLKTGDFSTCYYSILNLFQQIGACCIFLQVFFCTHISLNFRTFCKNFTTDCKYKVM